MQPSKYDFNNMEGEPAIRLAEIVDRLGETYKDGFGVNHLDGVNLPRRAEIVAITENLLEVIFPGFDGRCQGHKEMIAHDIGELLKEIYSTLFDQMCRAIRYNRKGVSCTECGTNEAVFALLDALPQIRESAKADVEAAYAGDPAATSYDEIILSYPGIKAITIQRMAHVLYHQKIPFIPRMMTEHAHSQTGIDIHPGAHLGKGIFIDHGTGVVVGETAVLGDNVRIYQGVTLGAGNFPKDACGMLIKGNKRHPTIGNNVTIYSGASVLGDITIGDNSVIGGNVWLTESLPPGTKITSRPPENRLRFANDNPGKK
ncbi:MAG: hypothetical protein LBM70_00490 [Victivallales bacterium]|jgi:serine O-acetyltransferase|nr:hypothetical protein [Victivallales bacterium]